MSGIVGHYRRTDRSTGEPVREMVERIAHRGPDGGGVWTEHDSPVGIGHQLLRTTPEDAPGAFPYEGNPTGSGVVLTADIRLDNRAELAAELTSGTDTKTLTDGELLRLAYERWGTDCPAHLLGAFAFAVWDRRERRLFCARDHMGIKPFYYHVSDDVFAFGSEIEPLLHLSGVSRRPNEDRIGEYLLGWFDDEQSTFYRDVNRLPPAHTLTVREDTLQRRRYWALDPSRECRLESDAAYERRFRELFTDAVRCRLRAVGPVGSFLSGGLDSSSITCVASDVLDRRDDGPLHTVSAVFDEVTECDEREYIDAVHGWLSGETVTHTVSGDEASPLLDVERHLDHQDGPFYPSLFMLIWRLLQTVEERGMRVLLHGYGGDQALGADTRPYPRQLATEGRIAELYDELRGIRERFPEMTYRELVWREVVRPLVPGFVRQLRHLRTDGEWVLENQMASMDAGFARRTGLLDRRYAEATAAPVRTQRERHHRSLTSGEPSFNLELNDMAAAAVGVETRYPYFDKRLVEFTLALPAEQNVQAGVGRMILRRALEGLVPPTVLNRDDKTEFSPNVVHTLRTYELSRVENLLFDDDRLLAGAYLDREGLAESFDRFRSEGSVSDARNLLMATVLELWLRRHTEQPAGESV